MKLMTQLLDIESIQPSKQRNYDVSQAAVEIEALARSIVEAQVLLSIPIVKPIDLENYELISGDLEFNAYLKALEFDKNLPDRIGVYIINAKEEDVARKQVELTRQAIPDGGTPPSQDKILKLMLENALKRLESNQEILSRIENTMVTQEFVTQAIERITSALTANGSDHISPMPSPNSLRMFHDLENILSPSIEDKINRNFSIFLGRGKKLGKMMDLLKDAKKKDESLQSFDAVLAVISGKSLIAENRLRRISDNWK